MKAKAKKVGITLIWIALVLLTVAASNEQAVMSLVGW